MEGTKPKDGREGEGRRAVSSESVRGTGFVDRTWWSPRLTLNEEPVVDDSLNVGVEEASDVMTHLKVRDVDQRAS